MKGTTHTRPVAEMLTTDELAAELKMPRKTLDMWRYHRTGPAFIKVGAAVRYRRSDVDAWLDAQTRGGDARCAPAEG